MLPASWYPYKVSLFCFTALERCNRLLRFSRSVWLCYPGGDSNKAKEVGNVNMRRWMRVVENRSVAPFSHSTAMSYRCLCLP